MDRATRKRFYNLCDPFEPLSPEDPRCVDVDAFAARGGQWADQIARRIELSERPVCELFTGTPGAGVTTELLRVASRLRDHEGPNLFVVLIDAWEVLDLTCPIDTADVLLAILQRTEEAVSAADGSPAVEPLRRMRAWLTDAEPHGGWTADERPAESLRGNPAARERVRRRALAEQTRFVAETRDELILLNERARRLGHEGVAVIVDGLERLRGLSTTWGPVLDSAERVFARGAPARELAVHVVYTLPPALYLRIEGPVRFLPMIELVDRDGRPHDDGLAAALEIVRRRVPEPILSEIFGTSACSGQLARLIAASGGSPRDLVRLVRDCVAEPALDEIRFSRLLADAGEIRQQGLPESAIRWLGRIARTKSFGAADEVDRAWIERLLSNGAVLRYQGETAWYDVHPAVRKLLPEGAPTREHDAKA